MIDLFRVEFVTEFVLLTLVTITGIAVVSVRNLFAAAMLSGVYSLLMALVWVNMYSMDVAFTEASVGAGISTLLFLGTLVYTGVEEKRRRKPAWGAMLVVGVTGGALLYGTVDMPGYGSPEAPVHQHVAPQYLTQTVGKDQANIARLGGERPPVPGEVGDFHEHAPNAVTGVLAAYRGFDTMFETAVIFTAGVCIVLLLRDVRRQGKEAE